MPGAPTTLISINGLLTFVRQWPIASQQQARRNAMIATTACTQRRVEREDVADFLAERYRSAEPETASTSTVTAPAARTAR